MTVAFTLWRIAIDASDYGADDLGGKGAEITGGRWNRKGRRIVYCSSNVSLACLETVVHLQEQGLPMNRYLVKLSVPLAAWNARETKEASALPVGWDAMPEGNVSLDIGDAWVAGASSPLLLVPSVIAPEEYNVLINPAHPLSAAITAQKVRKWLYDPRLFGHKPA